MGKNKLLFWVDLEMTGLDEKRDHIVEVAVVVTDLDLKTKEEFHRVVFQPPEILELMDDFVRDLHGKSGLTKLIAEGTPLAQVEKELLQLISRHFPTDSRIVLAGNSVGNDKRFLDEYMPELKKRLHYRIVDVSSFKEIFRERYGITVEKKNDHRALTDIHESISELEHYLSFVKDKA